MRDSLTDRCLLIFVLLVALLMLFLMVAETPSGQHLPAEVIAASMVVGMVAAAIGVLRSNAPGWSKPVVTIVGVLFVLLAIWSLLDPPLDYHRTLACASLGLVLLGASFDRRRDRRIDEPDGTARSDTT